MFSTDWYEFAIESLKNSTRNLRFICALFSAGSLTQTPGPPPHGPKSPHAVQWNTLAPALWACGGHKLFLR